MNDELVSVIVPVFNEEEGLGRCIQSIIGQDYTNLDIIIVDDCSTDRSSAIIKDYASKDPRIRFCRHDVNKGLVKTRLTGISSMKGVCAVFVDADDYIDDHWISKLYECLVSSKADIVFGDFVQEKQGISQEFNEDPIRDSDFCYEGKEMLDVFMDQAGSFYGWHVVWNKMYSAEILRKINEDLSRFLDRNIVMTEDIAFSVTAFLNSVTVTNVHGPCYHYSIGRNNVTSSIIDESSYEDNLEDVAQVLDYLEAILAEEGSASDYSDKIIRWRLRYWKIYSDILKGLLKEHRISALLYIKLNRRTKKVLLQ